MLKDSMYPKDKKSAKNYGMDFLKKLREERNLTKIQMADLLGFLRPTYYYYEDKSAGMDLAMLCQIVRKLKLDWKDVGKRIEKEFGGKHDTQTIEIIRRPRGSPRKVKND